MSTAFGVYQVRVVQDDDHEGPVETVPLTTPTPVNFHNSIIDAASMILRGYVFASQNDLRAYVEEWTAGEPEFAENFTAQSHKWTQRAISVLTVLEAKSHKRVGWDLL